MALRLDSQTALLLALGGFLTRLPLVFEAYGLFSSDAAAQGIMALHVLEGKHHPIFLYNRCSAPPRFRSRRQLRPRRRAGLWRSHRGGLSSEPNGGTPGGVDRRRSLH